MNQTKFTMPTSQQWLNDAQMEMLLAHAGFDIWNGYSPNPDNVDGGLVDDIAMAQGWSIQRDEATGSTLYYRATPIPRFGRWQLTDGATLQYRRKIGDKEYELVWYEGNEGANRSGYIQQAKIDLNTYTDNLLETILACFTATPLGEFRKQQGDNADAELARLVFEYVDYDTYDACLPTASRQLAAAAIQAYITGEIEEISL